MTEDTPKPFWSHVLSLPNPHLDEMTLDYLYHLGLSSDEARVQFRGVKIVCMGGSGERMLRVAQQLEKVVTGFSDTPHNLKPIGKTDRFHLYKVGSVLAVSHGMGMPSMLILLHEIVKLVRYANEGYTLDPPPLFVRIGTSGGVGVTPGTVVVTSLAVDGALEPSYTQLILGRRVARPTHFDPVLCKKVVDAARRLDIPCAMGMTMGTDDFYEGQARLDGAICEYTEQDKLDFLKRCHEAGVRNIEMESPAFAAFCNMVQVRGIVICVTLLDRLLGDQVTNSVSELDRFQQRAIEVACELVRAELHSS